MQPVAATNLWDADFRGFTPIDPRESASHKILSKTKKLRSLRFKKDTTYVVMYSVKLLVGR